MARSIREIRRRELEQAAFELICEGGFAAATLSRVAERVGMSRGIVHHYFRDKHALLEAAVREANRSILRSLSGALLGVRGPHERLAVLIESYFSEAFTQPVAQFWVAYLAQVPASPGYARIQRALEHRLRSNLTHELRHWLPREEARTAAREINLVVDGPWLRMATAEGGIDREDAMRVVARFIDTWVPGFAASFARRRDMLRVGEPRRAVR